MRIALILLLTGAVAAQTSAAAPAAQANPCPVVAAPEKTPQQLLLGVKRIYVDSFGEDLISKQLQSMVISSLMASNRFIVTENRERADAVMKGSALEKSSQETHAYSDSTAVGGAAGGHSGSVNGSVSNGNGSISGSSSGGFVARHMGISDSSVNTETIDDARAALRLVDKDGDVIWTTTQESKGAKYKGSSADVADKAIKQLLRDIEKLERPKTEAASSAAAAAK